MSAWSNIAYVIAGIALAVHGDYVPALGLTFLGIASYTGHTYGGKWWYLDWAGMYVAMIAIISHNIGLPLIFWLVALPAVLLTLRYRFDSLTLTGALWCACVGTAYLCGLPIVIPVIIFAIALGFRQYGHIGHDVWHILTATGFYLLV